MLIHTDGFDHYNDLSLKYDSVVSLFGSPSISTGRNDTFGLSIPSLPSGGYSYITKNLPSASTYITGFAIKVPFVPGFADDTSIVSLLDNGELQCYIELTPYGNIAVSKNDTVLGTASKPITIGIWNYVEVMVVISPTAGSISIVIDEVPWFTQLGINTRSTSYSRINGIKLGSSNAIAAGSVTIPYFIDDLIICDNTGTTNNYFLGDKVIKTLYPTGQGSSTQWTPKSAGANWEEVSEALPDRDDSYVSNWSSDSGTTDLYVFDDLPDYSHEVKGVNIQALAKTTSYNSPEIRAVASIEGKKYAGASIVVTDQYKYSSTPMDRTPAGDPWTVYGVNHSEYGVSTGPKGWIEGQVDVSGSVSGYGVTGDIVIDTAVTTVPAATGDDVLFFDDFEVDLAKWDYYSPNGDVIIYTESFPEYPPEEDPVVVYPPIFADGFESGDFSNWDTYYFSTWGSRNPAISSDVVRSGSYAYKQSYYLPGTTGTSTIDDNKYVIKKMSTVGYPNGIDHMFVRAYGYLERPSNPEAFDGTVQRKLIRIWYTAPGAVNGRKDFLLDAWNSTGGYVDNSNLYLSLSYSDIMHPEFPNGGNRQLWNIATIEYNRWYCFEQEFILNTPGVADGVYRLWIDNTLIYENKTIALRGYESGNVTELWFGSQVDAKVLITENRYWDDIVLSEYKIGL